LRSAPARTTPRGSHPVGVIGRQQRLELDRRQAALDRGPRRAHRLPALPLEHHRRVQHSNFIERTFGETRRRVKVIGRLPGEASCLSLVFAVLDRASRR